MTFELPNGIRCIYQSRPSNIVHVGLMINAGSRDETKEKEGLAHFIEHALFKGTRKRKAFHVLNRLEAVGTELNAYTTKEETCIYASGLKQDFARSLELICDITFNSVFPEKELKKEKDVINEEIQSYLDNPIEMIFDDFESNLFSGHSLGGNILGTSKTVNNFNRDDIFKFQDKFYLTSQMVISVVGGISPRRIQNLVGKYFSSIPQKTGSINRVKPHQIKPFNLVKNKKTNQAHIIIGNKAYNNNNSHKKGLALLSNILGGPTMNNRLSMNLREKNGMAYHTESHYISYTDSGLIMIYIGADSTNVKKSIQLVKKELQKLREQKIGSMQLAMAKKQIKGQIALAQENGSNVMLSLGKSFLFNNRVDTIVEVFDAIDKISAIELMEIANEIFDPNDLSQLIYN
jgi:predicted Zn-dependent peptidase